MPLSDSDAGASEDSSFTSRSSTNTRDYTPHQRTHLTLTEGGGEPSFDLDHVRTSTPRKKTARRGGGGGIGASSSRMREGWTSEESGADEAEEEEGQQGEALHASDTESVEFDFQQHQQQRQQGSRNDSAGQLSLAGEKLTRRSLREFSSTSGGGGGTRGSFLSSSSAGAKRGGGLALAHVHPYAPSPSTGSSTLVEEDYTLHAQRTAEKTITLRGVDERDEDEVGGDGEEEGTVHPAAKAVTMSEEESSSSPDRSRRGKRASRAIGDLASYVDAKMSASFSSSPSLTSLPQTTSTTPPRRPRTAATTAVVPPTPAAPGAYPPTPARPLTSSRRSPSSASAPSAAGQIHDAFSRLITGPDGALTHAQERRAGLSASQQNHQHHQQQQYGFVPSSSLPIERSRDNRRSSSRREQDTRDFGLDEAPSKLEQALRQLREAQRAEGAGAGADRSAVEFAMARSFVADQESEEEQEHGERGEEEERYDPPPLPPPPPVPSSSRPLRQSQQQQHSVRFASPPPPPRSPSLPPSRSSSPPPQTSRRRPPPASPAHRPRSLTPDPLPPLPPPILPESPEPQRVRPSPHHRASSSSSSSNSLMRRSSTLLRAAEEEEAAALASQQQQRQQGQGGKSPRRVRTSSGNGTVSTSSATPTPTPPPPPTQPVFASSTSASTSNPASSQRRTSPPVAPPPANADATTNTGEGEANLSLPHLVSQLSSAVKALAQQSTSSSPSPKSTPSPSRTSTTRGLNAQGLPSPPREREDRDELRKEFERRRKESDRRRRELEVELEGVEARGLGDSKTRQALLEQLADTYSTEQELGFKVDELRRSIEEMGVVVGGEVAAAVGETLKADGRTRARWLAWVFGTQLLLFLLFLRLANQHTSALFPTLYHDPFSPPALFHLPPLFLSSSSAFSPETFAALAPNPSLAGESVAGRVWAMAVRALPFSSTAAGSAAAAARGTWAVVPS